MVSRRTRTTLKIHITFLYLLDALSRADYP